MNLNLRIIAEELAPLESEGFYADDVYTLGCTYPLRYREGMQLEIGPAYIALAEEISAQAAKHASASGRSATGSGNASGGGSGNAGNSAQGSLNIICIGEAPAQLRNDSINLLQLPPETSPQDVVERLQRIFYRYYRWESEVRQIIQDKLPLRQIAVVSQDIVRNPMLCSLHGFKCIFHNADSLRAESKQIYEEYCRSYTGSGELLEENAFPSLDVINDAISDPAWALVAENADPVIYPGGKYGYPSLCYNIGPVDHKFGRLVFDGMQHEFTSRDYAIIKVLGDMLGKAILLNAPMNSTPGSNLSEVLRKLLQHKLVDETEIRAELASMGWDVFDHYFLTVLTSQAFARDVQTLSAIANGLIQQLPNTHVSMFEERLVCIVNLTKSERSQSQFMEYALPILRDNFLIGGISLPFDDLKDIYDYYGQADCALKMGSAMDPTSWFYMYDSYMLDDMCERIVRRGTPEALAPRGLRRLRAYDETHENNLVPLLQAYLECGGNIAETSRRLFIHRNTCLYRLRRINEVGGIDLDDSRQRLELSMVFAVEDYCEKYGASSAGATDSSS